MISDLRPSLEKGVGELFLGLGLGWGRSGGMGWGWMTARLKAGNVSRYTSGPHLDLKQQFLMHDGNKNSTLHIHLVRPRRLDH